MVEDVKHLRAELQIYPLGDVGVLQHGKIGVHEIWPDQGVASERPQMTGPGHDRIIVLSRSRRRALKSAGYRQRRVYSRTAREDRRRRTRRHADERFADRVVAEPLRRIPGAT